MNEPTCPECGGKCEQWEIDQYSVCTICHQQAIIDQRNAEIQSIASPYQLLHAFVDDPHAGMTYCDIMCQYECDYCFGVCGDDEECNHDDYCLIKRTRDYLAGAGNS